MAAATGGLHVSRGKRKLLALGVCPDVSLAKARDCLAKAREQVAKLEKEGRAEKNLAKIRWLLSFAYPVIGTRLIREISAPELLGCFGYWKSAAAMNQRDA